MKNHKENVLIIYFFGITSCLFMVGGSLLGTPASSTTKTGCHDIAKNIAESGVKHNNSNQILRTKLQ
jgi:hypothetical protein